MNYTQIVEKLIGPIDPVGVTETDNERFENLKAQCQLVDELIMRIQYVANTNINRPECSMKRAGEYAAKFLIDGDAKLLGEHDVLDALKELANCDYTSGTHLYAAQQKAKAAIEKTTGQPFKLLFEK